MSRRFTKRGWASDEHIRKTFEQERGIWNEKTKSYILPAGTVKQGRRPMFKPFSKAEVAQ